MAFHELAVQNVVRSGRADVGCRAVGAAFLLAQELDLDRVREVFVFAHLLGVFAMDHDAGVHVGPAAGVSVDLLVAEEPVLESEDVVRVVDLIEEEVAELAIELVVVLIADLDRAILDAVGFLGVFAKLLAPDLGCPAGEVLAVEQGDEALFVISDRERLAAAGTGVGEDLAAGGNCDRGEQQGE